MSKKVLMVNNTFGCGGNERQMCILNDILKKYTDYEMTVLYYARDNNEFSVENMSTVYIEKKLGRLRLIHQMRKYIRENDIKIVHAWGYSGNIYSRMAVIGTKAKAVSSVTGQKYFSLTGSKTVNSLLNLVSNWWTVNNYHLVDHVMQNMCFMDRRRVRVLHNGFAPSERIDYKLNEITEFDEDKRDNFVFCTIGRLHPIKNYPLFVKAAAKIVENNKNVRFWMVGDGTETEKLKQLITDYKLDGYFKMWGYRADTDVAVSRADAFVQTSFTEGSPNTIAEAMRSGKPIISTDSCDLSEMISEGKNGYITKNDDVDDLVRAMQNIINLDRERYADYCEESKRLFNKTFLEDSVAKEFERFYNELLNV